MKISIVVPVFNAGSFLTEAVKSIFDNKVDCHDLEIILIDDKSTDMLTLSLLEKFENVSQIQVIRQQENGGPAKARNAGLRAATGDWIGFLDADDIMAPGAMAHRLRIIEQLPEARWILADILQMRRPNELSHENHFSEIHSKGQELIPGVFRLYSPTAEMLTWSVLPVLGAMLIRKDLIAKTGLLGEELTYGEDIHFCLILSTHADLYWTPQPCLHLRRYHESMTRDTFRGAQAMPKASLLLLKDERFQPFRKQLRWQHAANLRLLCRSYIQQGNNIKAIMCAVSALRWVPNDMRNLDALRQSLLPRLI